MAFRLPSNVKPTHYDLTICTDLEKSIFKGLVEISLDVIDNTNNIVLNWTGNELGKSYVVQEDSRVLETERTVFEKEKRVAFTFDQEFEAGTKIQLVVSFSGEILDNQVGYYQSSWEKDGETSYYALSQFAPIDARRGFPCWDEPDLKATFAITLVSRNGTTNLSNMPAIEETPFSEDTHKKLSDAFKALDSNWKVTRFETTPPASTYVVAYANGEFSYVETSVKMPLSGKTIPLRMYATPDLIHQAQSALELKSKVLPLCEQIFDVQYPLPKLDTLVVTNFGGAMENWGLITGRTRMFLLDPNSADILGKKMIIRVHSHEIAHMWFGNNTTMKWWDYLYLNEGFATLMGEVILPDRIYPELKFGTEFINRHLSPAMALDAKLSSHPIEVSCPDPDHIPQIFDALSYSKAAAVLSMLSAYVGLDRFLQGVSIYLKNHVYGSTTSEDLWKGISEATGLDIAALMNNWVTKMGFPLLIVTETETGIKVKQHRLLETGLAGDEDETIWNVPLSLLTVQPDGTPTIDNSLILKQREQSYILDTSRPYKLNAGTKGVYRVLYPGERLKNIANELLKENSPFSAADRLGLIIDSLALAKAALLKLSDALNLIGAMRNETEYLAWSTISIGLTEIVSIWWEHPEIHDQLNAFRRSLFAPIIQRLGFVYDPSESPDISQLRTLAVEQCVAAGETSVVDELKSYFKPLMDHGDDSKIHPDLQRAVFLSATKYGGREEYDAMKKVLDKPKTTSTRVAAIYALTGPQDANLINETLNFLINGAKIADVAHFFLGFSNNGDARKLMAKFFHTNYDELYKTFIDTFYFKFMVEYGFSGLTSQGDLDENIEFFKMKDTSRYSLFLEQSFDSVRARIATIKHSTTDLETWLDKKEN